MNKETRCCATCFWHDDFSGASGCGESPHCADFTDGDHLCPQWAERPPWKDADRGGE